MADINLTAAQRRPAAAEPDPKSGPRSDAKSDAKSGAKPAGEPIWDLMARHLRARKTVPPLALNVPTVAGATGNPGSS